MDDIQRRDELSVQIRELKEKLKPLEKEYRELNFKIKKDHMASLPYQFEHGFYNKTKKGLTVLYWNYANKTYYQKPLYKPSGVLYGINVSRFDLLEQFERLKSKGYKEIM